jgi:hypothetical protein
MDASNMEELMKKLLFAPLFFVFACGDDTGTVSLTLNRVGDPALLTANNNGTNFAVTLSEGEISFAALNLVDLDTDEETPTFDGIQTFNFFAEQSLSVGPIEVEPITFEEIHVIPADAIAGAQIGKALHLAFAVTLSNAQTANVTVDLTLGAAGAEEQKLANAVDVAAGDEKAVTIALDLTGLVSGIDYDALAASVGDTIAIEDGTGNVDIDNAVAKMVENVFTSFAFVNVQ